MFEAYLGLLICQGIIFMHFYLFCSKSSKIDCNVANKAKWIQKEQEQEKKSPIKEIRNKRYGCVLKLRVIHASKQITKSMLKNQEGANMWCGNYHVSIRDLSQESLKSQCYLSARSVGIFKQHELLAQSLQTKNQRGERPNGKLYDFLFLPRFIKCALEQSQERNKHGPFSIENRSWERPGLNLRYSGPGCDHDFIAWYPCQLPSILPACMVSLSGEPFKVWSHWKKLYLKDNIYL